MSIHLGRVSTYQINNRVYYFWQPKAGLSPHAHAKHIKEIHTNMSNTANVIDNWL